MSDRPPPPSVPLARILKFPRAAGIDSTVIGPANTSTSDAGVPLAPSTADREADYQQRRKQAAAADNKAANDAREKAQNAANCNAARQNQRALDDGVRISSYDPQGERTVMGDQERAELAKMTQKVLAGCK
ncbi:MAG: DUF4124 domain-containing protein [Duganella sp.]